MVILSGGDPKESVNDVMVENLYVEVNKFALVCTIYSSMYMTIFGNTYYISCANDNRLGRWCLK